MKEQTRVKKSKQESKAAQEAAKHVGSLQKQAETKWKQAKRFEVDIRLKKATSYSGNEAKLHCKTFSFWTQICLIFLKSLSSINLISLAGYSFNGTPDASESSIVCPDTLSLVCNHVEGADTVVGISNGKCLRHEGCVRSFFVSLERILCSLEVADK